jgi:uncharacterized membrane protein YfcA
MSVLEVAGLVLAGIGGGLTGSIAGLASLVTYPALLAVGLSPIGANVTNTVALVWSSVGSTVGSRPELVGQAIRIRRLVPLAVVAGAVGAALALLTPSGLFARIVPWLILAAALAIVARRRGPVLAPGEVVAADRRGLPWAVAAIGVYGGYFGAAAGVVLLAVLLAATSDSFARVTATKNVVLGAANAAGAVVFAVWGPVRWTTAVPLAVGCFVGARLGPVVVRRVPTGPLRLVIGVLGVGLAGVLAYRAY